MQGDFKASNMFAVSVSILVAIIMSKESFVIAAILALFGVFIVFALMCVRRCAPALMGARSAISS